MPRDAASIELPFVTFGDLAAAGLRLEVWCLRCHRPSDVALEGDGLLKRPFAGARFRCDRCGSAGHPSIRPIGERIRAGSTIKFVDVYCGNCVPPWEIRDVRLELPPWSAAPLARGERYICPGCGRPVAMLAQGQAGIPFTERYREEQRS